MLWKFGEKVGLVVEGVVWGEDVRVRVKVFELGVMGCRNGGRVRVVWGLRENGLVK